MLNPPEWNGDNTEGRVRRASDSVLQKLSSVLGWKYCMKTICIIVYTDYFTEAVLQEAYAVIVF